MNDKNIIPPYETRLSEDVYDISLISGKNLILDPFFKRKDSIVSDNKIEFIKPGLIEDGFLTKKKPKEDFDIELKVSELDNTHKYFGCGYTCVDPFNDKLSVSSSLRLRIGTGYISFGFLSNNAANIGKMLLNGGFPTGLGSKPINSIRVFSNPTTDYAGIWTIGWICLIDLTDIFGIGNEPSLSWCNENITPFNVDKVEITIPDSDVLQYPDNSILVEIKKLRGIEPDDKSFDTDIIAHINTAMFFLKQLEVGPENGFRITGYDETWDDFWVSHEPVEAVKDYIDLRVSLLFDPPSSGVIHEAKERMIKELEYRLNVECDTWPYYTKSGGDTDEPEDDDADVNWGD